MMRIVFHVLLILVTHSLLSLNTWEPPDFPDSLRPKTNTVYLQSDYVAYEQSQ